MTLNATAWNELPSFPTIGRTKDGAEFDCTKSIWDVPSLMSTVRLSFEPFKQLESATLHKLKLGFLWELENRSTAHARNLLDRFKSFYQDQLSTSEHAVSEIEISHILNFRSKLDATTEWYLGVVRILIEDLERLGIGIAAPSCLDYLREATFRGNVKGTSIRTRDPQKGAFSDVELQAIQAGINDAFARKEIGLYAFAMTWLFLGYGARPIQIAALKESDLAVSTTEAGRTYALRIPRAKQRWGTVREAFKTRYCSKQVGHLLEQVISHNKRNREKLGLVGSDFPMFMGEGIGAVPGFEYHIRSHDLRLIAQNAIERATGLKANTKRFRITLAQRAVDDGKDKFTVAEMLDHSDTQHVEVYFEAAPALVQRLDRHLAMELAPLAQAFAGVIIGTEWDAQGGDDPSRRIYDRSLQDNSSGRLGNCGQMSFCGLAVPFSCYTCRHFQPWLDGPHEAFLAALADDRERMRLEGYSPKIYAIKDRTMLAVAEVIQLCAGKQNQSEVAV